MMQLNHSIEASHDVVFRVEGNNITVDTDDVSDDIAGLRQLISQLNVALDFYTRRTHGRSSTVIFYYNELTLALDRCNEALAAAFAEDKEAKTYYLKKRALNNRINEVGYALQNIVENVRAHGFWNGNPSGLHAIGRAFSVKFKNLKHEALIFSHEEEQLKRIRELEASLESKTTELAQQQAQIAASARAQRNYREHESQIEEDLESERIKHASALQEKEREAKVQKEKHADEVAHYKQRLEIISRSNEEEKTRSAYAEALAEKAAKELLAQKNKFDFFEKSNAALRGRLEEEKTLVENLKKKILSLERDFDATQSLLAEARDIIKLLEEKNAKLKEEISPLRNAVKRLWILINYAKEKFNELYSKLTPHASQSTISKRAAEEAKEIALSARSQLLNLPDVSGIVPEAEIHPSPSRSPSASPSGSPPSLFGALFGSRSPQSPATRESTAFPRSSPTTTATTTAGVSALPSPAKQPPS